MVNLFDKVRIKNTGEIGFVVDISPKKYLIIERDETDTSEDRLIYDVPVSDVEVLAN